MTPDPPRPRLVCFVNGIFSSQIGGGDIYFAHMMRAAMEAGYPLHFFGGHALKGFLEAQKLPLNLNLTDSGVGQLGDTTSLGGQLRLLMDFARRLRGTLRQLHQVQPQDVAYAMSDYWFDSIPLMRCRARRRIMYLGMMAPSLKEVLTRSRADVSRSRLASIYYWASQQSSLRRFARRPNKLFTYSHPHMRPYLSRFGYQESELRYVPNGIDLEIADRVPPQAKVYDLVWTGRVHPQKGIEDLLASLAFLARTVDGFQAVIIGRSQEQLAPHIRQLNLESAVTFAGLVTEEEKFRLLKASRVFAMPSRYESWGIVVGEALAAGIPVIAYDLDCYRPVFGDLVRYVKPFDREAFLQTLAEEITAARTRPDGLNPSELARLKASLSWEKGRRSFLEALTIVAP